MYNFFINTKTIKGVQTSVHSGENSMRNTILKYFQGKRNVNFQPLSLIKSQTLVFFSHQWSSFFSSSYERTNTQTPPHTQNTTNQYNHRNDQRRRWTIHRVNHWQSALWYRVWYTYIHEKQKKRNNSLNRTQQFGWQGDQPQPQQQQHYWASLHTRDVVVVTNII